jgi:hypothetical protein
MNFDKALRDEIKDIFNGKIFAIAAPQNTTSPFCVYRKISSNYQKTLSDVEQVGASWLQEDSTWEDCSSNLTDGMTEVIPIGRTRSIYDLAIFAKNYDQLQNLVFYLKNRIIGFVNRQIGGSSGPFIFNITVDEGEDQYADDINAYRANLQITAQY